MYDCDRTMSWTGSRTTRTLSPLVEPASSARAIFQQRPQWPNGTRWTRSFRVSAVVGDPMIPARPLTSLATAAIIHPSSSLLYFLTPTPSHLVTRCPLTIQLTPLYASRRLSALPPSLLSLLPAPPPLSSSMSSDSSSGSRGGPDESSSSDPPVLHAPRGTRHLNTDDLSPLPPAFRPSPHPPSAAPPPPSRSMSTKTPPLTPPPPMRTLTLTSASPPFLLRLFMLHPLPPLPTPPP